jgi:dienelactone hydrolase
LFVEDIHHPSLIFLTEQDEVVPTQEVKRYVKEHDAAGHVAIEMIDHDFHGSWMLDPAMCARVTGGVERLWAAVAAGEAKGPSSFTVTTAGEQQERGQQERGQQQQKQRAFPLLRKGLASLARGLGLRRRWRRRSSSSSKQRAAAVPAAAAAGKGADASAGTATAF